MKQSVSLINQNLKYPFIVIISFLLSGTGLFGGTTLCAAFIGSLSGFGCVLAFAVSAVGMIFHNTENIPVILSSFIIIGASRLVFGKKNSLRFELPSAAFTGSVVVTAGFIKANMPSELFGSFALGLIAGGCAFSLMQCYKILITGRHFIALNPVNTAATGIVGVFFITALTGCEFGMLNLGVISAVYLTLAFSEKYGFLGAAVCGTVTALGIAIGNNVFAETAPVICMAGIVCVLLKNLGRLPQATGFVLTAGICSVLLGVNNFSSSAVCGVLMGSAVFYIIPPNRLTELFGGKPAEGGADLSEIYAERLRLIGQAMGDVKHAIVKTSEILDKKSYHNYAWVYNSACDAVCERCRHNMKCWGQEYGDTVKEMERLVKLMRTGKQLIPDDLPLNITRRCDEEKKIKLITALIQQYREYTAVKTASRKLSEMRAILTAQLSATEKMLESMADGFCKTAEYDKILSAAAEEILENNGITDVKAAILTNGEHLTLEAYGKGKLTCTPERLCDLVSSALKHEFDLPNISSGGDFKLTMYERTVYAIECGAFQYSKGTGKETGCGDYYDSFIDGRGHAYVILSDGMGSGSRARIDSAFACGMLIKLLEAGVNLDSAIEIINNSLLVKSADESFATLDICEIDLYTGKIVLYKAGSAPTYIKCNKRVVKARGRGMPIGISDKPQYEMQSFNIGNSDIVIMTSDGAELSERWLEHELNKNDARILSMSSVAESVANAAKFAAEKGREDDISVIAVRLVK